MNKLLSLLSIAALSFASCGETATPAETQSGIETPPRTATPVSQHSDVDPVCGMVRDSTWTDYTLHNGDTIWFCAAPEMKAFIANPDKYLTGGRADSIHNHQP